MVGQVGIMIATGIPVTRQRPPGRKPKPLRYGDRT